MKATPENPPQSRRVLLTAGTAAAVMLLACHARLIAADDHPAQVVAVGAGSYSTLVPPPCKPLPERIFKTAGLKGPTVTGQWWSSLLWQEFSANLFAHPLGMVCTPEGLAVAYPGASIVASAAAIMGGGVGDHRQGPPLRAVRSNRFKLERS